MAWGDTNNFGQEAVTGDLGTGLYEFGVQTANLPVSEAATTASQVESGGNGFNWNNALHDITGAWVAAEGKANSWPGAAVQYRRGEDGRLYNTDGKLVQQAQTAPKQINLTTLLIMGGIVFMLLSGAK